MFNDAQEVEENIQFCGKFEKQFQSE